MELVTFFRSVFPAEHLSSSAKVSTKKSESERDQTTLPSREVGLLTKVINWLHLYVIERMQADQIH